MSSTGTQLVKFGALALAIQNTILVLGTFVAPSLLDLALYIDLVGFLLLAGGYIMYTQQENGDQQFLIAGVGIGIWFISRIFWQFILTGELSAGGGGGLDALDSFFDTINKMIWAFLFSAIGLLVAGYMINKVAGNGGTLFFSYSIVNFIATFLIVQPFIATDPSNIEGQVMGVTVGFLTKLIVIPIMGVILFFKIFSNTEDHLGMAA